MPTKDALVYLENLSALEKIDQNFHDLDSNDHINEILTLVNQIGLSNQDDVCMASTGLEGALNALTTQMAIQTCDLLE